MSRAYHVWKCTELRTLARLARAGYSIGGAARFIGRPYTQTAGVVRYYGLPFRRKKNPRRAPTPFYVRNSETGDLTRIGL